MWPYSDDNSAMIGGQATVSPAAAAAARAAYDHHVAEIKAAPIITRLPPGTDKPVIETFAPRQPPSHDKPIELILLYLSLTDAYQVVSTTDTTWYKPGDWLAATTVGQLSDMKNWKTTSTSYDLLSKIFGLAGTFVGSALKLPVL